MNTDQSKEEYTPTIFKYDTPNLPSAKLVDAVMVKLGKLEHEMYMRQNCDREKDHVRRICQANGVNRADMEKLMQLVQKKALTTGEIRLLQEVVTDTAVINNAAESTISAAKNDNILLKIATTVKALQEALQTKVSVSLEIANLELRLKRRLWHYIHRLTDDVSVTVSAIKKELSRPGLSFSQNNPGII